MKGSLPMSATIATAKIRNGPASAAAVPRDFVAFTLWVFVTFVQFRFDELLLYPLTLYFTWSAWKNQRQIINLLRKAWILLSFPLWCLISPLWAAEPVTAFKLALYVTLTMLICFQAATRLSPRQIMHAVLLATSFIVVINFLNIYGPGGNPNGIFAQKNTMGKNMVVAWVVASAVALDPGSLRRYRWAAAGAAALAAYTTLLSSSATAVLLLTGTGLANLFGAVILRGGVMRAGRMAALCLMLGTSLGTLSLVVPYSRIDPVEKVLDAFGKDRSLTGRTGLWSYAEQQIAKEPLLGVGAGGFWRYHSSPLVKRIYEEYYKGPRDVFNFHSSFYEIAVHQGLIGLGLVILSALWALARVFRGALGAAAMPQIYFLSQSLAVLVRTATEADFFLPFIIFHMLFWIGALSALKISMDEWKNTPLAR
ncbi:O-antigen ligase [Leisingera sp. NJS201]|uniref:O-antigen ligase family protein n=1 Tax=Leisingera sp. NJS201 TaxID=2508306 RepID=UPI0020C816C3|nr:O-antigen ligase family protein [Leisingera sp. NJS201]